MTRPRPFAIGLLVPALLAAVGASAAPADVTWRAPAAMLTAAGQPATATASARQTLAPGAKLAVTLPATTPFRWRVLDGDAAQLRASLADNGDLFRVVTGMPAPGDYRWLPPATNARRLLLENTGAVPLTLRTWVGDLVEPAAPPVRVALSPRRAASSARTGADGGATFSRDLHGPARIEIESRMLTDAVDARPGWTIVTRIDESKPQEWHLVAPVDRGAALRAGSAAQHGSLPRSVYLDIPAGTHHVAAFATRGVLLRAFGGDGLLFAGNRRWLYPRADEANARAADFQAAREKIIVGDGAAASADWRAFDPSAALLATRAHDWFDIEPGGDGPLAFAWPVDADTDTGAASRFVRIAAGQSLTWQTPPVTTQLAIEASGDDGTTLTLLHDGVPTRLSLHSAAPATSARGRALIAARGGDIITVTADPPVLVRVRGVLPRGAEIAATATDIDTRIDLAGAIAAPLRAPAWFVPLAERLAERVPTAAGKPDCRDGDARLPADWRARADNFVAAQRPDDAARLFARARLLCRGGESAGDALAKILYDSGEFRSWVLLRKDDAQRRDGDSRDRAIRELRDWFRAGEDWVELETLGAQRAAAGDWHAWDLLGEALVQQGEDGLVRSVCAGMNAAQLHADTPLLAHACRMVALHQGTGQPGSGPWSSLAAVDGTAGGLRTLENIASGQRASRYLARDDAPLVLRVHGPTLLRVETRRLLDRDATISAPGWISVALDEQAQHLALDAGVASRDWRIAGSERLPAAARHFNLRIPAGIHAITVRGDGETLVGITAAAPDWLAVLPQAAQPETQFIDEAALGSTDIERQPTTSDDAASDRYLLRLAWWAEHTTGSESRGHRARLHALLDTRPASAWRQGLLARIDRQYSWQRESRIVDSAGMRYIDGVAGGSPSLRLRRALLDVPPDDVFAGTGAWLSHDSAPGQLIDGGAWQRVRILARQVSLPGSTPAAAEIVVAVDDRVVARHGLAPTQPEITSLAFAPGAGLHRVVVRLDNPAADMHVQVRLEAFDGARWQALSLQSDRSFLVSRASAPVRVAVDGPEWLRVDEIDADAVRTRYVFQPVAGTVTLAPPDGAGEVALRVSSLREDAHPLPPATPAAVVARPSLARARAATTFAALDAPIAWQLAGTGSEGPDTDASDTAYVASDDQFDDNAGVRAGDATTLGWLHRQRLATPGLWWRSDLFARALAGGDRTVGTTQLLEWHPAATPWYVQLDGAAFAWLADSGSDEQSLLFNARWRFEQDLDRAVSHRVGVEAFGRLLSADAVRGATVSDADVWSAWKHDHRHGLRINERWRWQPVADAALQLDYGVNSNESFSDLLESSWLEPSARVWWRGVALDASLRWQSFAADGDRRHGYENKWVNVGVQWHRWHARGGWFVAADWRRELDSRDDNVGLTAGWTWGAGPRAFPPSELPFRTLEERVFDRANPRDQLATDTDHAGR